MRFLSAFLVLLALLTAPVQAALVWADRVYETTSTTGTGTYTLNGAVTGYQSFAVVGNGNTTYYAVFNGTDWEFDLGTYSTTGPTITRDTVLASSNGGAAVSWPAGSKQIYLDLPAEVIATFGTVTGPGSSTNGDVAIWNGTGGTVLADGGKALPSGAIVGTTDTQTLSAKTLASPAFTGTVSGSNTVPLGVIAQSGANTMLGNWTGSTANVAANSMPSCADSGGNHLNYVSGTGITCGTSGGANNVTASGTLTSNALVLGAGSKAVSVVGSLGTTTTVLHGNASGPPSYGAVANADLTNSSMTLAGHTVSLGGTQTFACGDLSNDGTACTANTGTSGANLPFLNGTNTWSGAQTFGEVLGTVTAQSGTTYTFAATDCGTEVTFSNASAVTATIPATLPVGCNIAVLQTGAGQVAVNGTAVSAATLHSAHSYTKTSAQWAIIGINIEANSGGSSAIAILTGDGA